MSPNSKSKPGLAKGKAKAKGTSASSPSTPKTTPPPKPITERTNPLPTPAKTKNVHPPFTQPRRALSNPSTTTHLPIPAAIPVRPKLLKRFYEALVILSILGRNRGERTSEEEYSPEHDAQDLSSDKLLRRAFARNLAYLCDFKRGGESTTAIALEQTPQGVVYHVASNKCPSEDKARAYLRSILSILKQGEGSKGIDIDEEIFQKSVQFSSVRILQYGKELKLEIDFVLGCLDLQHEEDTILHRWLQEITEVAENPEQLCKLCYSDRHSPFYGSLQHRARPGQPLAKRYEKIRHLMGRLNHTMKAVKLIIDAAHRLPHLLDDFKIVREKSSRGSPPPLQERNPSLSEIAGRMFGDAAEIETFWLALEDMDRLHGLEAELKQQCSAPTWRPRVHAELLLLDKFSTQDLDFVDGDRYIGCSKPACYCCYHYIAAHPGGFVVPACHNNNWLNWRPPDVFEGSEERLVKAREKILLTMVERVRGDAVRQIMERRGPNKAKPDSLTEISTVRLDGLRLESYGSGGELSEEDSSDDADSYSRDTSSDYEAKNDGGSDLSGREESDEESDDEEGGVSLL